MKLLSINVAQPQTVTVDGRTYRTGINKRHRMGRAHLSQLGLAGDGQGDSKNHGGAQQAVYCYPHEHYGFWAAQLRRDDWHYGAFGENLTLLGALESAVQIGDTFQIGSAIIQVSQPRVPCYKLADKLGIPGFEKTFLRANRVGFYARVLQAGVLEAGDPVQLLERDEAGLSVAAVMAALYLDRGDPATVEKAAQLESLSPEWQRKFQKLLAPRLEK